MRCAFCPSAAAWQHAGNLPQLIAGQIGQLCSTSR
jgi:hypothetical protein